MKRLWTALVLIALMVFFGISGENRTNSVSDRLLAQSEALTELCCEYGAAASETCETARHMYEDWKKELNVLTLYMNNENLRPVTTALREAKEAANKGDMESLDSALRKLSYAVDDMRASEELNIGNVF